ncbi:MAG: GAF domain-containing protein [Planctomycetes bacterium]|nr:GAF domain-containing protein [Planctomycetota bacterium]
MDQEFLTYVLNVSRKMSETRLLIPLLNYVVGEVIKLMGAERGYIVVNGSNGSISFKVKRDKNGNELQGHEDQVSRSIINEVLNSSQPLILKDAMKDPRFKQAESVIILKLRSIICVPLVSRGETIGAIYIENRSISGRFNEEDASPLILFANQAAVAIENATLNDNLEARVATRTKELEHAMLQVEKGWEETVEANRLRTVWLSNVIHDLRSPLTIVLGSLSMLQMGNLGNLNDEQLEWTDKAFQATNYVINLTNDLFDLAKLEVRGITLQQETVVIQDFLQNIYDIAKGLPWKKNVTLKLDIFSSLLKISIDTLRISQVLFNLLSNAQKFTTEGSVTIHAIYRDDQKEVMIGVADTGEGIPSNKLDQLFQRFQQVDDEPKRRRLGAGLGLDICRELVGMHGGSIWAESTLGVGSDLMFTLPLHPS